MFGIETLSGNAKALALVGLVFVQAISLYVVYGALGQVLGPRIRSALRGE
ncbi:DUF7512 family protein [Halorussus ruber]|nr:hypothetical protein [Halorussus ruber]